MVVVLEAGTVVGVVEPGLRGAVCCTFLDAAFASMYNPVVVDAAVAVAVG